MDVVIITDIKPRISLNRDTDFIKLIAAAAMVCDHFGKIFSPEIIVLQVIGRISFPIFAYCLVVGALYTRNIKKYMLRLLIFALISQPLYIQAFSPGAHDLYIYVRYKNILFSLLTGLIAIYGWREKKWLLFAAGVAIAAFAKIDYGIAGVLMILSFYWFRDNNLISFVIIATQMSIQLYIGKPIDIFGITAGLNGFSILSLPLIYCKTKSGIKISKYFFYFFYPGHLLAFIIIHALK